MNKKRILALLLVIAMAVLVLSACGKTRSITANNLPKGKVLLSSLSQKELVKFLEERNIAIYEPYKNGGLSELFSQFEEKPDLYVLAMGNMCHAAFKYKVQCAVCEYYGIENPYSEDPYYDEIRATFDEFEY